MKLRQVAQKIIFSIAIVFLAGTFNTVLSQELPATWSLEDCINYAIENNIQIKQSELGIENNEVNLLESKLSLLPSLNASTRYSYSWGRILDQSINAYVDKETQQGNLGVDASVTLFSGLQKQNSIKKDKIDFLASQYDADKMKDDISLLLTQAYLSILFNQELLKVAREQVSITKEQIDRTAKMVEAGTLAKGSLLEMQAQGAREELSVINYENSLALAYLDLLQILDLPGNTEFKIIVPEISTQPEPTLDPLNQVFQNALVTQPVIKSAELGVESSYKSVALAKGGMSPSLSLFGGWGTNYSNNQWVSYIPDTPGYKDITPFGDQFKNNQNRYMGLNLSIPIFNGYQVSSNISRAKINAANQEYNFELTKNTLRKEIEQAYNDALAAYKSFIATNQSLQSFEESFRYTEQKFNVGMANSVDYNIAKSQVTSAESELIRSKFDFIFKTKILDFYQGKPLTLD
ncbi:MAG: TolC family protein [Bacteroidales bacterium]|nr:TolC family protein [Bacteroidales bacterium]